MNPLIKWMVARETLRRNKEAGKPRPWTDDDILARYRFTNIRRRDDRVSRWIIKHVVPLEDHPEFLEFLALCRWVNWPPTIDELLLTSGALPIPIDWKRVIRLIDRRTARKEKAWTGAYMIRADNRFHDRARSKADYIVNDVILGGITPIKGEICTWCSICRTRAAIWELIKKRHCWGSFMAGQFVDDLTWTKYLSKPLDDVTWAPQGPGSKRGFNRILGRPLKQLIPADEWQLYLMCWHSEAVEWGFHDLTLMDIQNCLCETDKYLRVKLGEGRPRSTYKPEMAYQV